MQNQSNATPAPCQYDAGEIFKGRPSGRMLSGYDTPAAETPAHDAGYIFYGWQNDLVMWWSLSGFHPLFITGPAGCGKTSGLKQIASRVNYPVYEITGHASLEASDLFGCLSLAPDGKGGTATAWQYGPLALAMRDGGLFIFNEMDAASPSSLIALNTILDGSPLCLEQGSESLVIKPSPYFRFAATGNSNGSGDASGDYAGVMRQNFALQDRFICLEAAYPPQEVEESLVRRAAPQLPDAVRKQIADFASLTRASDDILPMSTRALLRWAALATEYAPAAKQGLNVLEHTLLLACGNVRDRGMRQAYQEILQRVTGNGTPND